jgi:hypothetical protein
LAKPLSLDLEPASRALRSGRRANRAVDHGRRRGDLGEDEDWPRDVANEMEIEDRVIGVSSEKMASRLSPTSESKT